MCLFVDMDFTERIVHQFSHHEQRHFVGAQKHLHIAIPCGHKTLHRVPAGGSSGNLVLPRHQHASGNVECELAAFNFEGKSYVDA